MKTLIAFLLLVTPAFAQFGTTYTGSKAAFNSPGRPMHSRARARSNYQPMFRIPHGSVIYIYNRDTRRRRRPVRRDTYRRDYERHYRAAHTDHQSVSSVDVSARYGGGPLTVINPFVKQ